ncbi:MAG: hypothetical protein WD490_03825, partial [Opitutales bacterium]
EEWLNGGDGVGWWGDSVADIEMDSRKYWVMMFKHCGFNSPKRVSIFPVSVASGRAPRISVWGVWLVFVGVLVARGIPVEAEGLFSEENRVPAEESGEGGPPGWLDLIGNLEGDGDRLIEFEEKRFFPALETTVSLAGRIRYSPNHGISLEYFEPERKILIFDERGVIERAPGGRDRELPSRRARLVEPFSRFLLHLFRGDTINIHNDFSLFFAEDVDSWSVGVRPTDWRVQRHLASIVLRGAGVRPGALLISLTDGNSQEITLLDDSETPFTRSEREAFFR